MPANIKGSLGLDAAAAVQSTIKNKDVIMDTDVNERSLFLDSDATSARVMEIQSDQTSGETFYIICLSQKLAAGTNCVVRLRHNSATSSSEILRLEHAGTGPDIQIVGRATGSIAAAAEGAIAYDTTLHKLKIRGAAGWETITSV